MITFVISITGVIFNGLLVIVIILDPLRILRKGAWVTIINLAFADLLTSVGTGLLSKIDLLPLNGHSQIILTLNWINLVQNTGVSASFFLLTLLTVETYVITKFPLHRKLILTRKKVSVACTCTWLVAILLGALPFYAGENSSQIYIAWIGILELSVAILVFFKILVILEIIKSRRSFLNSRNNVRQKTIAKTVISLNIILVVTALPYFVGKQLEFLARLKIVGGNYLFRNFSYYYLPVASVNFIVNPVFYAWRLPDYRNTLKAIFTKQNQKTGFQLISLLSRSSTRATDQRDSTEVTILRGRGSQTK